jgi:O-methyltransferase involved in polyketide biosynthesis
MEGLLIYLKEEKVNSLLETIADLSVTGSYLGADLVSTKSVQLGVESQDIRKNWRFGTDLPEQLFAKYDWKASVCQPGDEGASFGRYTEPLPPREVPEMRRAFFVTANKIN